jgi:hypothetical protein
MATRIHVTAVRGVTPADVRGVFTQRLGPGFECVDLTEHGGWISFSTSVWAVDVGKLNQGLCELARPAVQFSTSDNCRWYLTVHGGPAGQVSILHEFGNHRQRADPSGDEEAESNYRESSMPAPIDPELAFLEEDPPPGPNRPLRAFDGVAESMKDMGTPLPESFVESVARLPYHQAFNRFQDWHVDHVLATLKAAGIPVDERALATTLCWESLTEAERDSDLGNLPRLLSVLGLGGAWDDWVRKAEHPEPEPEPATQPEQDAVPPAEPPPRRDFYAEVMAACKASALVPLSGGPVEVPLKDYPRFAFFADACIPFDGCLGAMTVELPPSAGWKDSSPIEHPYSDASIAVLPNSFQFGVQVPDFIRWDILKNNLGAERTRQLRHAPDQTLLELAFADPATPATCQRYRGRIIGKNWVVEETYPSLKSTLLSEALKLAGQSEKKKHACRDESEAVAVMEAVRRDDYLFNMGAERSGRTVSCEYDVGALAKILFRLRYAGAWNVALALEHIEKQFKERRERDRQMRRAGVIAARQRAAPHEPSLLLRGRHTNFWAADLSQLADLEPAPREQFEQVMATHGFTHVGDLVAKKQRDMILRVYVSADSTRYGVLMAKRTMYLGWEYFTRFDNETTLTTTTLATVNSHPEVGVFYLCNPGVEPLALYRKHEWGIARFRTHKQTAPAALPRDLQGVAREIDAAFGRVAKAEPLDDRIVIEQVPLEPE